MFESAAFDADEEAPQGADLRERRRLALKEKIRRVAVQCFIRDGYDATSMRDISVAVGISERTLFRHIGAKDELLHGIWEEWAAGIYEGFQRCPEDLSVLDAYRRSLRPYLERFANDRETSLGVLKLLNSDPALRRRARNLRINEAYGYAPTGLEIARRLGVPPDDSHARLFHAFLAVAVVDGELDWAESGASSDLFDVVNRNIQLLEPVEQEIRDRVRPR